MFCHYGELSTRLRKGSLEAESIHFIDLALIGQLLGTQIDFFFTLSKI